MRAKGQIEHYHFEGDEAINGTLDNTAVVDRTSSYDHTFYGATGGVVDIAITGHGYIAGDANPPRPNFIFIQGTTNYDGLRRIVSIPDADTVRIVAKYVAEEPAGTEVFFPGVQLDEDYVFLGFEVHLNAASATSENFTANKDAYRGASFDTNFFTQDFNTVQDYVKDFENPRPLNANDIIKMAWANTNDTTWGIDLTVQRIR
jgi:hypothetical protein